MLEMPQMDPFSTEPPFQVQSPETTFVKPPIAEQSQTSDVRFTDVFDQVPFMTDSRPDAHGIYDQNPLIVEINGEEIRGHFKIGYRMLPSALHIDDLPKDKIRGDSVIAFASQVDNPSNQLLIAVNGSIEVYMPGGDMLEVKVTLASQIEM